MEHREPPRIAGDERRLGGAVEEPEHPFRLRAFSPAGDPPRARWRRAGWLLVVGACFSAGIAYLGWQAAHTAVSWLHHQPQYLVPFGGIQLLIQPPPCYRGGSAAFLEHVAPGRGRARADLASGRAAGAAGPGLQARSLGGKSRAGGLWPGPDLGRPGVSRAGCLGEAAGGPAAGRRWSRADPPADDLEIEPLGRS